MQSVEVFNLIIGASLGGLITFAWSQITFANRLTRLETKLEAFEEQLNRIESRSQFEALGHATEQVLRHGRRKPQTDD